jgi:hypothetical protein
VNVPAVSAVTSESALLADDWRVFTIVGLLVAMLVWG